MRVINLYIKFKKEHYNNPKKFYILSIYCDIQSLLGLLIIVKSSFLRIFLICYFLREIKLFYDFYNNYKKAN